ncbi:unnamed protein product [Acidithrix sp. C25]|nr:unnamed protein product [Acidithrix sp. C25]
MYFAITGGLRLGGGRRWGLAGFTRWRTAVRSFLERIDARA